jgi:ligand-binding sensor domain-containing protein
VRAILPLADGRVIIGTRTGAYVLKNATCQPLALGPRTESIGALAIAPDGTLWFATFGDGLFGLAPNGALIHYDEEKGLLQSHVRALAVDKRGRIWAGGKFGVNVIDNDRVRSFTIHQGMPNDNVWCLFRDNHDDMWIGTDGAGLLRFAGDRFVTWTTTNGLCSDLVMALVADNQGDLWLGTYGNGVCRMDGLAAVTYLDGLPNNTVWCAAAGADSSLWFGTSEGLAQLRHGRIVPLDSAASLAGVRVLALQPQADGSLWCGTREGLAIRRTDGTISWPEPEDASLSRSVRAIAQVGQRHFLATDQGVLLMEGGVTKRWSTTDGLCDNTVQCLLVDTRDRLWIGTTNGLACFHDGAIENIRLGSDFGSNYIDLLLSDSDGEVWAGTNNGLFRFHPDSLLLDHAHREHFTSADGPRGSECNLNAGFRDAAGRLFFGTNAGIVMHDPSRGPARAPMPTPVAVITDLRSFMQTSAWKGQCDSIDPFTGLPVGLRALYGKNHLTFDFSAVALMNADRLLFQYRMLGVETDWLPPTPMRSVSYSNLSHGEYRFEVRASLDSDHWGPVAVFSFSVAPPYWLRWWFFALCGTMLAGIAFAVIRFRNIRARRQEKTRQLMLRSRMLQLEQQALNANMNRHFIFNALNSIQFYINRQDRTAANRYLTSFAKLIRKNLDASRTDTTSLTEELDRLELYLLLEHMRFKDKFSYRIEIDPAVHTTQVELPAMMLQPYVENSIWHGILPMNRPGEVVIGISPGVPGHVRITITDDGIGVDQSRERKSGGGGDHISRGIEITKGRADVLRKLALADIRIEGPVQLQSPNGEPSGTRVTIELPSKESAIAAPLDLEPA